MQDNSARKGILTRPGFLVLMVLAAGYWAYTGFASPDTLLRYWTDAKDECVKFGETHKADIFMGKSQVKATDVWLKNGKVVVELGGFNEGDESYSPRLCVLGGGRVQIVSIFENSAWR